MRDDLLSIVESLRRHVTDRRTATLPSWRELPPSTIPKRPAAASALQPTAVPSTQPVISAPSASLTPAASQPAPTANSGSNAERLRQLFEMEIGDCHRCPLGDTRIKLAFGVGNPEARVMFVGEGPGYQEDRAGEPFVGPAGQLLDKILASIGLSRRPTDPAWKWIYIANVVKCHPMKDPSQPDLRGNDRPPAPTEIETCRPFLEKQMRIIRPRFAVALGAVAAQALLRTTRGITALRGRWVDHEVPGDDPLAVRVLPTYHPAALLRDEGLKKDVWEDMKTLRAALEQTP